MHTFEQLKEKVIVLLKDITDIQKRKYLQNLQKQIVEKQVFYNSIPDSIKTTNTLRYIIESLTFKLDQFNYKQTPHYNIVNTNYEEDYCTTNDTINIAYLTRNAQRNSAYDTQIIALNNIRDTLQQKLNISEARVLLLRAHVENLTQVLN